LFEVRKSLESLAARTASERMTAEELDQLRAVVAASNAALDSGDLQAFEAADREFHRIIVAASRNDALTFSLRVLSLHIQLIRHLANLEPRLREDTRWHRDGIVDALAGRDGS